MKLFALALTFCLVGVVDQINGKSVLVEFESRGDALEYTNLPLWVFPCKIKEGDVFHITQTDESLEVKCGAPKKEKK